MNTARHAALILLIVTAFWGLSFPLVKTWQSAAAAQGLDDQLLSSVTLIALRMFPSLLLLALGKPRLVTNVTRTELGYGAVIGFVFFLGFVLQVWALAQAIVTPALSAFLTSLACVWAPLLAWGVFRVHLPRVMLPGLGLAVVGTALLCWTPGEEFRFNVGVTMTVVASVMFACQILLVDRLGKRVRGNSLTVGFLGMAGVVALFLALIIAAQGMGIRAWMEWIWRFHREPTNLLTLALLILLCTTLSFHWMNTYQPHVGPARAALIYLLEPLSAAAFSIPWGLDTFSVQLVIGGSLIVAGNAVVELWGHRVP